ncbi:huntingtin-like isoform X2 [Synchiropus splendidus]|uniref:huntingtin-like isoform X2 n=1 Tax=Synchiropus splendidus TaxID=270530 RepID=UPI00237D3D83|nr:huntingtin-like isoform X2 [Synchiropus splendidus]
MATMEKLMKAFESLKSFQQQQGPPTAEEIVQKQKKELATTKKDRVTHCLTICENIVAQSLRTSPEFQKLLGIAMEMFLLCSDDSESDVRMVADECLNKIIKALMDSNLPRLQLELYKEIKKNGASRSLRAALWRFAELAHLIRPQKCRPYLVNLLPCLTRITKRQEEMVQETLATAIPKIMTALGNFANDGEIKVLLRSFVSNLKSSSPTIRRTAASSAVSVCQHSRRATYFYTWLLNVLLGLVVPVDDEHPSHLILGVLLTLRYLMPLLQQQVNTTSLKGSFGVTKKEADVQPTPELLLQVYELTLHYTQHWDHNVVTAALELLQQTFRTPPPELLHMLISTGTIPNATIFRQDAESRGRSSSILDLIGGGSSCSPLILRKQRGKMLSGEEDGLEDDPEKNEVTTGQFTASVVADGSSVAQVDIITEQPRSSQHTLQPGDSVDLSASSDQGGGGATSASDTPESPNDNEEEMLSQSSSGGANITPETADYTTPENVTPDGGPLGDMLGANDPSLPPSDSSQTTTEGPDSAITPSDVAELPQSRTPLPQVIEPSPPSPTSTEGPDAAESDSSVYIASSSSSSSFSFSSSSSFSATTSSNTSDKVLDGSESQYSGMQIGTLQDEEEEGAAPLTQEESTDPSFLQSALALSKPHLFENRGHNRQGSDSSVDRFIPKDEPAEPEPDNKPSRIKGPIGHYTDQGVEPLVHCVRLLAASFLLTGQKNGLIPDKEVRVSVKALAVSCIGAAGALHPEAFFNPLYLEPLDGIPVEEQQYVSDVLGLVEHGDPQIRGATAILCGAIIQAALTKSRYNIHSWQASVQSATGNSLSLVDLVPLLQKTLHDECSVTCKLACSAVRHCIMTLCSSTLSEIGLQLLIDLLSLRNSSYWLVRTELLETLAEMDFRLVSFLERRTENLHKGEHHYTGRLQLQDRVLNNVVIQLLGDDDPRVRHVAASVVSRLVSRLFYDCDQGQADPVVAIARDQSSVYLQLLMHEAQPPFQFTVSTITRTYRGYKLSNTVPDVTLENNLSRVVAAVSHALTSSTSKALTFGCCEALCLLASNYPVCTWSTGWHCGYFSSSSSFSSRTSFNRSRGRTHSLSQSSNPAASISTTSSTPDIDRRTLTVGMANMVLSLLSSAWFPLDLSAHQDALLLCGNLLAAVAPKCMRNPWTGDEEGSSGTTNSSGGLNKMEEPWAALSERSLVAMLDQLFSHLFKTLNICAHVLDDNQPGPAVKATLPSLTNPPSLSPIRRKGKEKDSNEPSVAPLSPKKSNEVNTGRPADNTSSAASNKSTTLGSFYHLPPYLKLYDVLKATHCNYKVSLDLHSNQDKFGSFLRSILDVLSQLLELATLHDISKCVEEILGYLKSCFSREPTMATVCVQQLLKTLFGTNLASQYEAVLSGPSRSQAKALRLGSSNLRPGLYHYCFMAPYTHFTQALADASLRNMVQAEQEQDTSGWFDVIQKASNQLRSNIANATRHRGDKNVIHNHIRLFEPLVIKALKQYTTSTSVALQRQVLDLLAQLVQLRVNYCLLDSDQVFIGFVLKQFEFIEVGQFRDSEAIIPNIFFFLVLLSYERYHSKQIISIPKIIQLCDGIMASERKAVTHAIPALQPIVHDLFVLRGSNKADAGKELDTQKEVVVSMLLRLVQHHQVLEMFILVLQQCHKENEDKWKRLSRQIADIILPMIAKQQMHLDSPEALGVLNTLFEIVAPSSLRPVDMLLKSMFTTPVTMTSVTTVQLWVSGILAILRVLVSQSTEDIVLSRVHELSLSPHLLSSYTVRLLRQQTPFTGDQPAAQVIGNQEVNCDSPKALPEETFARFLLQLVGVLLDDISSRQIKVDITEQQHTFYCQQLGTLLMCLIHIFKSGMFRRITAAASRLLKCESGTSQVCDEVGLFYSLDGLNNLVQCLITTHPSLVLLWCQVLLVIDYTNYSWWAEVHQTPRRQSLSCTKLLSPHSSGDGEEEKPESKLAMVNREIVRRGALILFCDYVCQNLHDSEHLTWLIVNHVRDLISLSHEPPVQDFISAIHRNSAASGLFIQAIQSRCDNLTTPTMLKKTLQCLEGIHLSQSGSLLMLYVDKLLSTPFRVLARMVDTLACRRVEMLLAETLQNSIAQLPVEELDRIQEYLQTSGLAQRHQRFYSLLDRFRATVADNSGPSPPLTSHPLDGDPPPAPELVVADKEWYVALVRSQCCLHGDGSLLETTELLTKLPPLDLLNIMSSKLFNLSLLCPCLSMGVQRLARGQGPLLLETSLKVTLEQISGVLASLPEPHQSFLPPQEQQPYWEKLAQVYDQPGFYSRVLSLCRALSQYLLTVNQLPSSLHISSDKEDLITTFTCAAIEVIVWRLLKDQLPLSVDLQWGLSCLCLALQQSCIWNRLSTPEYTTHACSLIYCLRLVIVAVAVSPGDQLLHQVTNKKAVGDLDNQVDSPHGNHEHEWRACEIMAELVEGLQSVLSLGHHRNSAIPAFLTPTLRNIVISLSRLPLVNSFTRVPPLVWKMGWAPQPGGDFGTTLPEIPVDFLQEKDVFRDFLYRINTLGWSSRTQFEETWATLLGVLVTQPITMEQEEETQQEEDLERTQLNVLAVQAITSLVLSAMTLPTAGNPAVSCLEQQPRNKSLKALETRFGRKLAVIRGEVEREIQALVSKRDNIHTHHPYHAWDPVPSLSAASPAGTLISHEKLLLQINTEREMGNMDYKLGQVSIHSVWLGNNITPLREEEWGEDEEDETDTPAPASPPLSPINSRKHRAGVDIHSCSQFLLELYSQWLIPGSPSNRRTPTILVSEVVRSLLAVSDLFTERNQFDMMFSTLMELQKLHPPEDEILNQYLVPAICKAASVLGMDKVIAEPVCRLLEATLRSTHLPSRMGALHGVLYVLECDLLDDTAKQLIPTICEYLLSNLRSIAQCVNLHNQQHVLVMCAVAFYMMENYPLDVGSEFMAGVIQLCGVMVSASEDSTPSVIYHCVLRGLERLLLSEQLSRVDGEALVKLSVDRVNMPSPHRAMAALGLMLTCMYTAVLASGSEVTGVRGHVDSGSAVVEAPGVTAGHVGFSSGKEKASPASRPAHSDPQAPDSESIIVAMERVSVLFDRIRKGLPSEARVVSRILPQFLDDFFPPQDIMNKVIGEFLSNQQPYPQFMATVVYKVFQTLHATGQSSMVRDWVLLSLSNFTQRTPVAMAMWSLSCFFVSASTSQWISALLPHVVSRMGSNEVVDVNLFCLVAMDFYRHQIDEELDRRSFQSVFETVAVPGSPYHRLLGCLQAIHQDTTL